MGRGNIIALCFICGMNTTYVAVSVPLHVAWAVSIDPSVCQAMLHLRLRTVALYDRSYFYHGLFDCVYRVSHYQRLPMLPIQGHSQRLHPRVRFLWHLLHRVVAALRGTRRAGRRGPRRSQPPRKWKKFNGLGTKDAARSIPAGTRCWNGGPYATGYRTSSAGARASHTH